MKTPTVDTARTNVRVVVFCSAAALIVGFIFLFQTRPRSAEHFQQSAKQDPDTSRSQERAENNTTAYALDTSRVPDYDPTFGLYAGIFEEQIAEYSTHLKLVEELERRVESKEAEGYRSESDARAKLGAITAQYDDLWKDPQMAEWAKGNVAQLQSLQAKRKELLGPALFLELFDLEHAATSSKQVVRRLVDETVYPDELRTNWIATWNKYVSNEAVPESLQKSVTSEDIVSAARSIAPRFDSIYRAIEAPILGSRVRLSAFYRDSERANIELKMASLYRQSWTLEVDAAREKGYQMGVKLLQAIRGVEDIEIRTHRWSQLRQVEGSYRQELR